MDDPLLRIRGLNMVFDGFHALTDIDLDVDRGLLVGLIGPNGCGKSTMMKCICRINDMTSGSITVDGHDVSSMKPMDVAKMVATVPAEAGQTFGSTVMDMVMLGRYPFVDRIWWEDPEDEDRATKAM